MRTRVTELLNIRHPIVLGGMARATSADLVAAVSEAGGLGIMGATFLTPEEVRSVNERIRALTNAPFGLNLLLFAAQEEHIDGALECRPRLLATAWRRPDQDLRAIAQRVHAVGALFMHQADTLDEAKRAADAGADLVVAQGTEGAATWASWGRYRLRGWSSERSRRRPF